MIRKIIAASAITLLSAAPVLAQDYGVEGSAETEVGVEADTSADTTATTDTSYDSSSSYSETPPSSSDTTLAASASSASGSASAANGRLGIGYFTGAAPVGIRMWNDDSSGFDVGIGLGFGTDPDTSWAFSVEGGYLIGLHTWEHVRMFGRVGVGLGLNDPGPGGVNFNGNVNGLLGAEFFMAALGFPMLSFSGGIGAQIGFAKPDGGDFGVTFGTVAADPNIVTSIGAQVGFHIYMP